MCVDESALPCRAVPCGWGFGCGCGCTGTRVGLFVAICGCLWCLSVFGHQHTSGRRVKIMQHEDSGNNPLQQSHLCIDRECVCVCVCVCVCILSDIEPVCVKELCVCVIMCVTWGVCVCV